MAKRKTPKVKDLRPETITDEQLKKLQQVVKNIQMTQTDIGVIESRKHEALHALMGMQQMVNDLQQEFTKDYGTCDVNITDGKIKYNDTDETNKKDNDR